MNLNIYNGIYLALIIMNLTIELVKDGECEWKEHNFFISLVSAIISLFLLYKGGFF